MLIDLSHLSFPAGPPPLRGSPRASAAASGPAARAAAGPPRRSRRRLQCGETYRI